ncbi:hypothetical protein pb186bvf_017771 [Paramecium bursaria]
MNALITVVSQQIFFICLLVFICPLYLIFANIMAKGIQGLYQLSLNKTAYLYQSIGDISWLFPLKQGEPEFKLVHIILIAILAGIVSILILVAVIIINQQEQQIELAKRKRKEA